MRSIRTSLLASVALCVLGTLGATPAFAQATYPTAATGVRVPGHVPLQCDSSGANCAPVAAANPVPISGTVTAAGVAQGSTTSGQTGTLVQCAVTTAAPTYTTAQTDPLSCTTTGGLRTRAEDGSNIGLGSLADAAWTTGNGSVIALLKGIDRDTLLPLAAGSNLIGSVTAVGDVASGVADSGKPVKIGGVGSTAVPSAVTDGQRVNAWLTNNGAQYASIVDAAGNPAGVTAMNADANPASIYALRVASYGLTYDGTTWDRQAGDVNHLAVGPAPSSKYWTYTSSTSPILSNTTTAVTIKGAAGAGVKIALDSCQIGSTALGASVPIAIRDGAGGTVKWAMRPPTAGWLTPVQINFVPPIVGTANTLMEVVTTTADTSGTFDVNCQGHTET